MSDKTKTNIYNGPSIPSSTYLVADHMSSLSRQSTNQSATARFLWCVRVWRERCDWLRLSTDPTLFSPHECLSAAKQSVILVSSASSIANFTWKFQSVIGFPSGGLSQERGLTSTSSSSNADAPESWCLTGNILETLLWFRQRPCGWQQLNLWL